LGGSFGSLEEPATWYLFFFSVPICMAATLFIHTTYQRRGWLGSVKSGATEKSELEENSVNE